MGEYWRLASATVCRVEVNTAAVQPISRVSVAPAGRISDHAASACSFCLLSMGVEVWPIEKVLVVV